MCFTCQQEMFYLGRARSNQTLISRIMHRSIAPSIATKEPGTVDTADGWLAKLKYLHFKSELLIQDLHKKRTKLFYVLYNSMPIVIQIHIQGAGQFQCPRSGQVSLLCNSQHCAVRCSEETKVCTKTFPLLYSMNFYSRSVLT